MDYISIGATPSNEECAQVGTDNYRERALKECNAYKNQLERMFPNFSDGCWLAIKGFPHDFGTYYEVVVKFDDNDEEATKFAYRMESESPENWDDEARIKLGLTIETGR